MRFWDSSAIVPLLLPEKQTPFCQSLLKKDNLMVVWHYTPTELLSAIHRKIRENTLDETDLDLVSQDLEILSESWIEVLPRIVVRERAHRLLATHPLRAADALQLAAAIIATNEKPKGSEFVTFDMNLASAARKEGFVVLAS